MTLFSARRTSVLLCLLASAVTWWMLTSVAKAVPPTNLTPPSISGTAQQGQTLTEVHGTWDTTPGSYSYQWESCSGATCTAISGATNATYPIQPADVGHTIEVQETAYDGSVPPIPSAPATSLPTATVTALPPVNSVLPTIAGTAQEGNVLTLTRGQWSNSPTITDQWEDCKGATCTPISGQTGATYVVTAGDVGHTITVLESATNTGGTVSVSSRPTVQIVAPPTEISAPSISGTLQQGSVLTENHGTWTGSPSSYRYQWERCINSRCSAIAGATSPSFTLTAGDVGATILVAETAINAGGPSAAASSARTGVVTTPAGIVPVPASTSPPTVSGLPQQGQTLLEAHGTWSGNPSSYAYQWESCGSSGCAAIPGATGRAYTPTAADVGQTIVVLETATNSGGSSVPAVSGHTAAVSATSATSLVVSPSGAMANQTVTLVATISSSSGRADPSGWLTVFDGFTAISGCTNQGFQSAGQTITIICRSSFPAGTARLTAVYRPSPGLPLGASASPLTTLNVGRDSTFTSLAVTKQIVRGKRATYTATVGLPVSNSGPVQPTGSIEFLDGGRPIRGCLSRPLTQLAATCAIKYKRRGRHQISARYAGDFNFASSTSPARAVQIVRHSSQPIVLGFISSTLQWQFYYHRTYTQVTMLRADRVVEGITVRITCDGRGCPFSELSIPAKSGTSIDLLPAFQKRHLRVGSEITLRIMRPNWIGKYYSFTVRAGRGPQIGLSCLGVGRSRPGLGC
jgi:Bacterial Ig-like domain (group 3)